MTQHYEPVPAGGSIPPLSKEKLWETIDIVARGWDEQRQRADGLEATAKINASAAEMWRERAEKAEAARLDAEKRLKARDVELDGAQDDAAKFQHQSVLWQERAERAEAALAVSSAPAGDSWGSEPPGDSWGSEPPRSNFSDEPPF